MAANSIYECIVSSMVDGELPDGFSLASFFGKDESIPFAPGARDGICLYHVMPVLVSEDAEAVIAQAVEAAASDDFEAADQAFFSLLEECSPLDLAEFIKRTVLEVGSKDGASADALFAYSTHLAFRSSEVDKVKLGLSILAAFDIGSQRTRDAVLALGKYDEFTYFCIPVITTWENGNDDLFALAKSVRGWGRVHAVSALEPKTEEIRRWLLVDGVDNLVLPEYSAVACYRKVRLDERLEDELSLEEFAGATAIIGALLSGTPMTDVMELYSPQFEQALELYVGHAARQEPCDCARACLESVAEHAANQGWGGVVRLCEPLLGSQGSCADGGAR